MKSLYQSYSLKVYLEFCFAYVHWLPARSLGRSFCTEFGTVFWDSPSHHGYLGCLGLCPHSFVKDTVSIGAWIYLWAFYFVPLIYISVFVPVPYCLDLEFTQTHVHRVSDAIQPSHPLSSPSPGPSKRGPGLGSFSRADRGIGGVRPVAPPTWLVSNFLVRNGRGPHLEGRQAPQASSAFRTPTAGSLQSWDRRVRPRLV